MFVLRVGFVSSTIDNCVSATVLLNQNQVHPTSSLGSMTFPSTFADMFHLNSKQIRYSLSILISHSVFIRAQNNLSGVEPASTELGC